MTDVLTQPLRALLRGAAGAFDLRGSTCRPYRARTDADALRADFAAVGGDLRATLDRYPDAS